MNRLSLACELERRKGLQPEKARERGQRSLRSGLDKLIPDMTVVGEKDHQTSSVVRRSGGQSVELKSALAVLSE